ncbi:MAG: ParA family protein [Deltaproteobacteria bacterium]|nr:ParA family protein [Deltaproteobacteria bacterium]
MARVIAVANQKGGVGKTVTSINVAAALARHGRRTLLVDLDPQGHCGIGTGFDTESAPKTTYELLTQRNVSVVDCAVQREFANSGGRLWFVPSNLRLSLAERELERMFSLPNLVLAGKLKTIQDQYDEVVLDCPPSLSKLTLNAFLACNMVIIPIAVGYFSIHGVRMLAETLRDIFEETGVDYDIRCLITRFKQGQTVSREVRQAATELFGDYCFETVIRDNIDVEKSVGAQIPLVEYAPQSPAAQDYEGLVRELLTPRVAGHEKSKPPIVAGGTGLNVAPVTSGG